MVTNSIFCRASCDIWQPLVVNCSLCSPLNDLIVNREDGGSDHITQGAGHLRGRSARLQLLCLTLLFCWCKMAVSIMHSRDLRWAKHHVPSLNCHCRSHCEHGRSNLQSVLHLHGHISCLACNLLIIKPGALVRQPPFFVFDSFTNIHDLNIMWKAKQIMHADLQYSLKN